jgi:hypothetical protein
MRLFDGFTNAERDDKFYDYFSAASEIGGHLPPIRGFARILVRRRKLQVFVSSPDAAAISVLQIDPALISRRRRVRLIPGSRRRPLTPTAVAPDDPGSSVGLPPALHRGRLAGW